MDERTVSDTARDFATAHLSTPELARRLHVQPQTVRAWRGTGRGPRFLRIGQNRVVYRVVDVETWEAERLAASTSEEATRHSRPSAAVAEARR